MSNQLPYATIILLCRLALSSGSDVEPIIENAFEVIDWDALEIIESLDVEGRLQVASDEQLYNALGFEAQDEMTGRGRMAAPTIPHIDIDDGAAIPVDDNIPDDRVINYDSDNPEFKLGALFPSMEKFRLAVRQYAMNQEFELHVAKTTPIRYDGYCMGSDDCTWHVHGRPETKGGQTIIVMFFSLASPLLYYFVKYDGPLLYYFVKYDGPCSY